MPEQYEADYRRTIAQAVAGRFLGHSTIEIIRDASSGGYDSPGYHAPGHNAPGHNAPARPPEHALFDFDGTLSLIREGWPEVMVPMMVEILSATGTRETPEELHGIAYSFVMELNGKQTIYQMIRLADEVRARGGTPREPLEYKETYHARLMERIRGRREALRSGKARPRDFLVPYSEEILDELRGRGVKLYLASGTDEKYVVEEARLLGLDRWFGEKCYGAIDDYTNYSKAMVIERILSENRVEGSLLLGFGDGYVEIENVKAAGGTAVAVATNEAKRDGTVDGWKRDRLIGVGADIVIPDYRDWRQLVAYLWNEKGWDK